jgi:glycosyltransferase involved in cell wall biosynthesis
MNINPANTVFVVLSFEGPDEYSMAGALGARVTHLPNTLADIGYHIHHFFIGDPNMGGCEALKEGRLILHRWCQWISQYHPEGVYYGEEGKLYDFMESAPPFVLNEVVIPAITAGKLVVILGEEWHTAEIMCRISELLASSGIRDRALMFWNANSTYGFDRIDWQRLSHSATITTVSKYMKQVLLDMEIDALIIPNGIPEALMDEADERDVSRLKEAIDADFTLSKVARWQPDRGWEAAIELVNRLKEGGKKPVLLACGNAEPYRVKIAQKAIALGLRIGDVCVDGDIEEHHRTAELKEEFSPYLEAISRVAPVDIFNFLVPIPHSFLRIIYRASNVVLANNTRAPFGLAGLEAMAAGALVFTGCNGEDYATHLSNAVVLDSQRVEEIDFYLDYLMSHPVTREKISTDAKRTSQRWTWQETVNTLICKLEYQAEIQGVSIPAGRINPDSDGY